MNKTRRLAAVFIIISMIAAILAVPASATATADTALLNFENGTQSFTGAGGAVLSASSEQAYAGAQSLKMSVNVTGASTSPFAKLSNPAGLTAGSTYEFHIWVPSGANIAGVQPYMMDKNWSWTGSLVSYSNLTKDSWNTLTLTIPAAASNPFNELGVQLQTSGDFNGSIYIDSIGLVGGTTVPAPSPASLSDLRVNGVTVAGFSDTKLSYIAHVPSSTTSASITATTTDPEAAAAISGGGELSLGENEVSVLVTAKDLTTKTYTIKLIRDLPGGGSNHISVQGTKFYAGHEPIWFNGANTPWDNWNDFGGDFDYSFWDTHFGQLHDNGVNATRVWITSNGEVGIDIDESGHVSGATAAHWNDLDSLFYLAQKHGVYIMATLMSFDHMKDSHPNYNSWRNMLMNDENIDSYVTNYVIPFTNRYKDNPYLWSIDFMNEPDWVYEESKLPWEQLQKLFAKESVAVHENSDVLTTVGIAMVKYNSSTCTEGCQGNKVGDTELMGAAGGNPDAKLDFWAPHYYDWMGQYWGVPMYMTPEQFGLSADRPAVIGETAALGTAGHTLEQDYFSAYANGWQGLMPWTSNGVDGLGDLTKVGPAASSFYSQHPSLVFPPIRSNDASLSDLQIDGSTVAGFSPAARSYNVEVPIKTKEVTVTATPADAKSTVTIVGGAKLKKIPNTVTVLVTAEDGTQRTYTLTVNRVKSNVASLSDLQVDGATIEGFNPDVLSYSIQVPSGATSVAVTAAALDSQAKVHINSVKKLKAGANTITVRVKAEDGTELTYSIIVTRG